MSKGISHPSRQKPIKKVECSTATRRISNHSMSNHKHSTRKNKKCQGSTNALCDQAESQNRAVRKHCPEACASFSTLKRVVKGHCSCRPLRERIHTTPEKVKGKCTRGSSRQHSWLTGQMR